MVSRRDAPFVRDRRRGGEPRAGTQDNEAPRAPLRPVAGEAAEAPTDRPAARLPLGAIRTAQLPVQRQHADGFTIRTTPPRSDLIAGVD